MNLGRAIVSHIILTGEIDPYLDRGLTEQWMKDPDQGSEAVFGDSEKNWYKAYLFLLSHFEDHGKVPSEPMFRARFGDLNLVDQDDSASELIRLAEERIKASVAHSLLALVQQAVQDNDLKGIEDALVDATDIMQNGIADDVVVTELTNDEFDPFAALDREVKPGIPLGIPEIDAKYHGIQPSWLVTIVGRQKAKKSWTIFNWALAAYKAGFNVRVYSVELTNDEAWERIYSLECDMAPGKWHVPSAKRTADNTPTASERNRLETFRAEMSDRPNKLTITQVDWGTTTGTIIRDVRRNPTDVVFFDGSYELNGSDGQSSGSDWRAQDQVARDLKRLALRTGVSVVTTTQSQEKQQGSKKKPGIKLGSVQAGSAYNRYSDLMIGLDYEDDGNRDEIYLTNMLARRNAIPEVILTWEFYAGCHADARVWEGGYDGNNDLVQKFMQEADGDLAGTSARTRTAGRELEEAADAIIEGAREGRRVVRRQHAEA